MALILALAGWFCVAVASVLGMLPYGNLVGIEIALGRERKGGRKREQNVLGK